MRSLGDGSKAVGLFNLGYYSANPMTVRFADIGVAGLARVRDSWARRDLGTFIDSFTVTVPNHGAVMIKVKQFDWLLGARWCTELGASVGGDQRRD